MSFVLLHAAKHGWAWAPGPRGVVKHMENAARPGDLLEIDPGSGAFNITKAAQKEETPIMEKPMKKTIAKTKSLFANIIYGDSAREPVEKVADTSRQYPLEDQREGLDTRLRTNQEYEASSRSVRQRLGDMSLMPTPPDATRMKPVPFSDNWLPEAPPYVGGKTPKHQEDFIQTHAGTAGGYAFTEPDANARGAADEGFAAETEDEQIFYGPAHPMSHLNMAPRPGGVGGMPVNRRPVRKAADTLRPGTFRDAVFGEHGGQHYEADDDE